MNQSESVQRFNTARSRIRMAMDAISRAEDGADFANWRSLELGYAVDQLTRATNYSADAIAAMNHEMNGQDEGKPTELISADDVTAKPGLQGGG